MPNTAPIPVERKSASTDNLPVVAYQGGFELLDARWDLNSGRTVKFRIVETPDTPLILHPFHQFVRRRGNRTGTRFNATIVLAGTEEPMYNNELMLMSGGNPLGQGMWVSFWLDDSSEHHPFAGYRARKREEPGEIFMVAMVELDDDDTVIDQRKRKMVEGAEQKKQNLSQYAALLCTNEMFLTYLSERVSIGGKQYSARAWGNSDMAAKYMRWKCGIESRSELDRDDAAAERFHDYIRHPYSDWRGVNE